MRALVIELVLKGVEVPLLRGAGATPVVEATPTLGVVPTQPLVADAPADAVARAEFTHGEAIAEGVTHEAQTFGHDSTLFTEHRRPVRIEGRRAR